MPNRVTLILSKHLSHSGAIYRVQMHDGSMRFMSDRDIKCCVNGDHALESFVSMDVDEFHADTLPAPTNIDDGPCINDVIAVLFQENVWHVGTVLRVTSAYPPKYTVYYDDDYTVRDRLCLPWRYISRAKSILSIDSPKRPCIKVANFDAVAQPPPPSPAYLRVTVKKPRLHAPACDAMPASISTTEAVSAASPTDEGGPTIWIDHTPPHTDEGGGPTTTTTSVGCAPDTDTDTASTLDLLALLPPDDPLIKGQNTALAAAQEIVRLAHYIGTH